jgi:hypothetical protein
MAASPPPVFTGLSFYLMAHQDDWQLFMGANAGRDMLDYDGHTGKKVVFIYVTAGDNWDNNRRIPVPDNQGIAPREPMSKEHRNVPYYVIREKGAKNSLHLAASQSCQGFSMEPLPVSAYPVVNGHKMYRYTYRNTVSYFLRLEEWWVGFSLMGNNPEDGGVAVDGSTTYQNWCDLMQTVAAIYTEESSTVEKGVVPRVNIPDYNPERNPNDHPSHVSVSRLAIEAVQSLKQNWPINLYVDYASQYLKPNLDVIEAELKSGLAAVYCLSLIDYQVQGEWMVGPCGKPDFIYQKWTARNYFETENALDINQVPNSCTCRDNYLRVLLRSDASIGPVRVAPNPRENTVTFTLSETCDITSCRIQTSGGREVFATNDVYNEMQVNTGNWESGYYFAFFMHKDGSFSAKKFAIVR